MLRYQKSFVWLVAGVLCLFCAANVQAQGRRGGQDQGGPAGPGGPGAGGPGGFGGPGGMGMMMGGGMGRNSESTLLGMEEVQKELILDEDQLKQLAKLRDDLRAQFEKMREMRDMTPEERDGFMAKMREAGEKMPGQIEEILLPQQSDRLKQLVFQFQMQMQSRMGGGFGGDLAEKLDISEDQQDKLRTKASELERQMRKEMLEKLVKELTPEQQEKYKELVGEPFEFPAQSGMGRGFGGPGGPGAPGAPGAPGGQGGRGQGGRGNRDRGN
jgi:hypothetical protein